jgi:hypothetical protein
MPVSKGDKAGVASTLAKLRNRARATGYPVDSILLLHMCERFLARVAVSPWQAHLVLKGGLNLYSRYRELARPTRDIDLAALRLEASETGVAAVLTEILQIDLSDGITFAPDTLTIQSILEDARYSGFRANFVGKLSHSETRASLQIDLSFGNAITPSPALLYFPNALGQADTPVLGYPLESVLSEKIAAFVELGATTTRLKDCYDLYQMISRDPPAASALAAALQRTFERRGTSLEGCAETVALLSQEPRLQSDWEQFLASNALVAPSSLETALQPTVQAVIAALLEL